MQVRVGFNIVSDVYLILVQYKHQTNLLLSIKNYTTFVIRNDKNKQLKISNQRKLALTAIK
jgi:hypothetical protein